MGIALWMVLRHDREHPLFRCSVILFLAQLVLNALWTPLFFWWHMTGGGLIDLVLLLVVLILTILSLRNLRPTAAWLLLPYALWLGFALALNSSLSILISMDTEFSE